MYSLTEPVGMDCIMKSVSWQELEPEDIMESTLTIEYPND